MSKVLKLHQANEDGATDINTQFTPVTMDGSSSSMDISQDIEADKSNTNKVPSTKAVYDFMSWIPKDIITNQEFDTGKTVDGKKIYGIYLNKSSSFTPTDKNIIYATTNLIEVNSSLSTLNVFGYKEGAAIPAILELQVPYEYATGITRPTEMSNFYFFIGFIFYTKK